MSRASHFELREGHDGALPRQPVFLFLAARPPLFGEIREILKRHGVEKKYGLALLHKHFDLADGEVLMDFADIENRTLITKPTPRSEVSAGNAVETVESLESGNMTTACVGFCYSYPSTGQHVGKHEQRCE